MVARRIPFLVVLVAAAALAAPPTVPDPKPDSALLILMRPGDPGGGDIVTDYLFADEKLIALSKGGTHSFVDQAPGTHAIWCPSGGAELDLVPGQKYFIVCGFFHGFSVLNEEDGLAVLAKTKPAPPVTPQAIEGVKKRERFDRFYRSLRAAFEKNHQLLPPAAAPAPPADLAGRTKVPHYSPVTLELMENLSSATATTGEKVAFRVVRADTAEGKPWLRPGSPVEGVVLGVLPAGRSGRAGVVVLDIASATAGEGVAVPLMGQLVSTARSRAAAATLGLAIGGLIGQAMVKGNDVAHLAGERFDFWTRDDVWLVPPADEPAAPARPADMQAKIATPLDPSMLIKGWPGRVHVVVEGDAPVAKMALVEVGGWPLPRPVEAASVTGSAKQGWLADFDSWSVLRYLRAADAPVPVRFRVQLADGRELIAEATPAWPVRPGS